MPLVYSAIAHQGEIECAFQAETGQFARVVELILGRMPDKKTDSKKSHRKSYLYNGYSYNYLLSHDRVSIF